MKYTLLEMVQDILNDMDADSVNSIDDTIESQQVAQILKTCYQEMMSNRNWPHQKRLMNLEAVADITRPNVLRIPDPVKELVYFEYDKYKQGNPVQTFQEVKWKEPESFLRYVSVRQQNNNNVMPVTLSNGISILIFNDVAPTYWTSFDDEFIVADSYDAGVDGTLQRHKTRVTAYVMDKWEHRDDFVPKIPVDAYSALLAEAKSTAFIALKQMANQKEEQKAQRQQRWLSRKAWRANGGVKYQNYGRKGRR